jgi:hypothetical protein
MKGKGERGNRDRGLWGKRKGGRGFLAKWPSSSSLSNQNREGERGGRGGGRPGGRGRRPGSGSKRRGGRGEPIPLLTSGWGAPERQIDGGGRRPVMVVGGGGAWGLGRQGGLVGVVHGEVGSRSGPFIGAERRFGRGYSSSRSFDGRQWR